MSPSEALRDILSRALELARGLGEERSLASEHVLFALLEIDLELRQALEARGLQYTSLEKLVWAAQGPPIQLDQPLRLEEPYDLLATARSS